MINAENICKSYKNEMGEVSVLRGIDFSAQKKEFCIITGESGCGKSTFLNVLSCLDTFDEGRLTIAGKLVNGMPRRSLYEMRRRDTSFIFQGYNLISSLTALENVMLPLKYQGVGFTKRRLPAIKALESVGLRHRIGYLPHQLSGGQQQRVAVARAIVTKPKILFCDEPTGNLDEDSSRLVLENLVKLKEKGTTIVMITHDKSLLCLADNSYLLADGGLVQL